MECDMTGNKIKQLIMKHAEILEQDYDEQSDLFKDLGFDSVKWMALLVDIEEAFNIVFDDVFILPENLRTHEGITKVVRQLTASLL